MLTQCAQRRFGRYTTKAVFGSGGMSDVYLAQDRDTEEFVAVKVVQSATDFSLRSIRGEIDALQRIEHPGVVRVLDHGVADDKPWYAMEIIRGVTYKSHLVSHSAPSLEPSAETELLDKPWRGISMEEDSDGICGLETQLFGRERRHTEEFEISRAKCPRTWKDPRIWQGMRTMVQACHVLKFLHGEGIVHCDLKPENIMVTDLGQVKLVDFGLVARLGSRIGDALFANALTSAGTVGYIAPERLRSEAFDARCDLYAIGCILYQTITGVVPFRRVDDHFRLPAAPSTLLADIPDAVDALVMGLLEVEPRDRPGHVLEILHVLAAVGVDIADGFGKAWKPYLYQPELRGREELLTDVIDDVIERGSDHRLIVLAGPSGSGKSRIALEVIGELSVESLGVLIGQCRPDREGTGVLQPFASMIRHVMDHRSPGLAASKETLKRARRVLGPYMPFLAPEQPDRVPSYLPVSVAQIRIFQAIETLLTAYSRDEPMVVVIDDLQWADSLTQRALDYFLRNQPLWTFLATLRSDEMTPSLDAILGHEGSRVVPVERLSSGAVQEIIRDMLGQETVPAALSKTVKAYANGNPFFAAACMRALIEEEVLSLDERGCWRICEIPEAFSMPEELLDSLRKRLSFLHVEARTLCEVASSLGRRSPLDVLEDVVALKGVDFDRAVADLAQRQILQWSRRAGSEELEFVHDQLVDLAYHSLANDEERCRRVHRQVVHSLRAKSARGDYVDTGHVAVHLERAGLLEEARLAYFESARQACARHGLAEAETLVMSGLRLSEVEDGPSLAAKIHFAKEVLAIQGRMKEAEKWLRDAVEKTASDVPTLEHAQALQALGRVLMWTGRAGETLEIFAAVREVFRALGNHRNEAKALGHMGIARRNQYRYAEALAHYEEALEITREVGDRSGEGIHLCNAGIVYKEIGQLRRALVHYEAAGKIATDLGDKRLSGIVLGNTGFIDMEQGRYEASFENFRAALQISRNLGDKRREGIWLSCLGRTHRLVGEFDEARKVQSEALELLRKTAVRIGLGVGLCEWGHLNLLAGQTAENELAEAALLAEELSVGPKSDLAVGLTRLQRAADAHARGEKLHFGECLDDVLASDQGESVDRDTAFMETNRWDP